MTTKKPEPTYITVEIYDQIYHLSGQDLARTRRLAARVDERMRAVAAAGRTADSLRVAVLAALNLADEVARAEEQLSKIEGQAGPQTEARANALSVHESAELKVRANNLRGLLDSVLEEEEQAG